MVDYAAFSYYMSNTVVHREENTDYNFHVNKNNAGEGDLSRSKKKSFFWYKEVIAFNGENL